MQDESREQHGPSGSQVRESPSTRVSPLLTNPVSAICHPNYQKFSSFQPKPEFEPWVASPGIGRTAARLPPVTPCVQNTKVCLLSQVSLSTSWDKAITPPCSHGGLPFWEDPDPLPFEHHFLGQHCFQLTAGEIRVWETWSRNKHFRKTLTISFCFKRYSDSG